MTDEVDRPERPSGVVAQVGAGVASLVEAWLRDAATYAVVLLSLVTALAGMGAGGPAAAVGILVGTGAAVAAVTPTIRRWRPAGTWLVLVAVAVLDVALVLLGTR